MIFDVEQKLDEGAFLNVSDRANTWVRPYISSSIIANSSRSTSRIFSGSPAFS